MKNFVSTSSCRKKNKYFDGEKELAKHAYAIIYAYMKDSKSKRSEDLDAIASAIINQIGELDKHYKANWQMDFYKNIHYQ